MVTTVEYVRHRIAPDDRKAFEKAYAKASEALAAAPECIDYELSHCQEETDRYVLRIRWTSVEDHLQGFRKGDHFPAFFAAIRPYVTAIEEMQHYLATDVAGSGGAGADEEAAAQPVDEGAAAQPVGDAEHAPDAPGTPTIHAWLGGDAALNRLTEVFYGHVLEDPVLAPVFAGMDDEHPRHVAQWLAEVFGGPEAYTAEHGGHPHMASRHLGRGITERQRRRWVDLLQDSADEVGLPADPEFRAVFLSYIEWGTRMAVLYSGGNPPPVDAADVPRWKWGQTPPWQPAG
ncbi:group II truncated hemoglobin [Streptomyces sp. NPDC017966]|uniref:group II truncated hemoglobin n=1 Tax=Streptomyces sp. NPDC017966 TaxID=3365023 RepID=UPI0037926A47